MCFLKKVGIISVSVFEVIALDSGDFLQSMAQKLTSMYVYVMWMKMTAVKCFEYCIITCLTICYFHYSLRPELTKINAIRNKSSSR